MQGTLYEIDIRSILQLIEQGQRTGELLVEAYPASLGSPDKQEWELNGEPRSSEARASGGIGQYWLVFFVGGKIVYAADRHSSSLVRLRDYLYSHRADRALDILQSASLVTTNEPEYAYLWLLLEKRAILPERGRAIIESAVEEIVFDLLGLRRGTFIFESGDAIAPQLTSLDVNPLLSKTMRQLQQWKQFHPYIQSPHQVFVINNEEKLKNALPAQAYESIARWADGKTSLRQLSRFLKRDLLTLSKGLYPYAERGWIHLIDPIAGRKQKANSGLNPQNSDRSPQIVCIDDDLSISKKVEYFLVERGCRAIAIANPIEALGKVFQLAPDIIFCDITMPQLSGLEICAMLRRSSKFRQTPIIMLTGKESFTDRVRARMAGASDYLTKPFGENELLLLLEKYLHH
jgi:twitching motility two-component system response regulator PilG